MLKYMAKDVLAICVMDNALFTGKTVKNGSRIIKAQSF